MGKISVTQPFGLGKHNPYINGLVLDLRMGHASHLKKKKGNHKALIS